MLPSTVILKFWTTNPSLFLNSKMAEKINIIRLVGLWFSPIRFYLKDYCFLLHAFLKITQVCFYVTRLLGVVSHRFHEYLKKWTKEMWLASGTSLMCGSLIKRECRMEQMVHIFLQETLM